MEYNTARPSLKVPEYGRGIHLMAAHLQTIADKALRTKAAHSLVEVMHQLHPGPRDGADLQQKLWDHLFVMAGHDLEVDSPFPPPGDALHFRPETRLPYPNKAIRIRHYGRFVEIMVAHAVAMEEGEERKVFCEAIANFMKMSYRNWNKVMLNDEVVFADLLKLSEGRIALSTEDTVLETKFAPLPNQNEYARSGKKPFKKKPFFKKKFRS
ncbi:MAG: DUF4290 domain-containing protein [Bacteroidota bacterium]